MQRRAATVCILAAALFSLVLSFQAPAAAQYDGRGSLRDLARQQRQETGLAKKYLVLNLSDKQLHVFYPELKGLRPAESQQELKQILEKVGVNQTLFLDVIPNISCYEDVVLENLDANSLPSGLPVLSARYSFLVLAHSKEDSVRLNEYRGDENGIEVDPQVLGSFSLSQGFALLPLHFHPVHQAFSKFRYLGRQVLDQQDTYVVAFAQQSNKAQLTGLVNMRGSIIRIAYQGIAWIEPQTFQIVRMRTDLLKPIPEAGSQTTEIRLAEVHLPNLSTALWLPHDVVITKFSVGGGVREKHQFSDYKKFLAEIKILPAEQPPAEPRK